MSSQCKSDSMVQGTNKRAKKRERKTSRSRRNGRMGGGKNLVQKENKRGRKVFGVVERVHGRRRYMREKRKFEKCRRSIRRI